MQNLIHPDERYLSTGRVRIKEQITEHDKQEKRQKLDFARFVYVLPCFTENVLRNLVRSFVIFYF